MGLQNSVKLAKDKYIISLCASFKLMSAVTGEREFSTDEHMQAVKAEQLEDKKYQDIANDVKLRGIIRYQGAFKKLLFLRYKQMGAWMGARGTTVTGTILAATELCYFLCARYNVTPLTFKSNVTVA